MPPAGPLHALSLSSVLSLAAMLESPRARLERALVGLAILAVVAAVFVGLPLAALRQADPVLFWAWVFWRLPSQYVMPVAGASPAALANSFGAPRSGGRSHEG